MGKRENLFWYAPVQGLSPAPSCLEGTGMVGSPLLSSTGYNYPLMVAVKISDHKPAGPLTPYLANHPLC